jgi:serpin B
MARRNPAVRTLLVVGALPALLLTAPLLAACGQSPSVPGPRSAVDLQHVSVSTTQLDALAAADARFAQALWSVLASRDGNVVLSPASIATALQMAYVGARGATATEMARALHFDAVASPVDVAARASRLLARLAPLAPGKKSLLTIADQIWLQKGFAVVPDFRAAMTTGFGSAFHLADFAGHGEDARRAINSAIAAQTRDRIRDLLPAGTDLRQSRLVLTNAIYLKAAWVHEFEPVNTAPAPFTRDDGTVVRPKTMSMTAHLDYAATDGYQAVRLPYDGGRLAMTLLLPAAGRPLTWPTAAATLTPHDVDLRLPKFTFTWREDVARLLAALGMPTAFTDGADFSGMSSTPLHIGVVEHKAFIAVDEKGTEAAAATAVTMDVSGAYVPGAVAHLHLDRPFLFRIDDTATGLPLFLGKVADPTLGG